MKRKKEETTPLGKKLRFTTDCGMTPPRTRVLSPPSNDTSQSEAAEVSHESYKRKIRALVSPDSQLRLCGSDGGDEDERESLGRIIDSRQLSRPPASQNLEEREEAESYYGTNGLRTAQQEGQRSEFLRFDANTLAVVENVASEGNGTRLRGDNPLSLPSISEEGTQREVDKMMMNRIENPSSNFQFRAHTFLPSSCISKSTELKLSVRMNMYSLAPENLTLRLNDKVVLTRYLSEDLQIGTAGVVTGLMARERIRFDLEASIRKLQSPPHSPCKQRDLESALGHLHAVEVVRSPAYAIVKFVKDRGDEEERLMLPQVFQLTVPALGTIARLQVPLLRAPLCRCGPQLSQAKLFRCHNGGPNHGRCFFSCAKSIGQQCGFFVWKTAKIMEDRSSVVVE
eukprot:CAMPEP_0197440154 /NCGR_PEP_ID=MMETSP1175-20131217/6728_1 /TAXON_ID=1003142 /ORGANISM="Triceratium dubium, Strain CCMP147" /LENGTH=397 /DNA_ID=CAMNT_0042970213 /DNA_START=16 /DNA_END=1209 /DNA_ORIENTATION=+